MVKKNKYWFKPSKGSKRLTIANGHGLALIVGYAVVLGLSMSFISLCIEDGHLSSWVGVPIIVSFGIFITAALFVVAMSHSKYKRK